MDKDHPSWGAYLLLDSLANRMEKVGDLAQANGDEEAYSEVWQTCAGFVREERDRLSASLGGAEQARLRIQSLIDQKIADYCSENGSYDPTTNHTELSDEGESYIAGLEDACSAILSGVFPGGAND